MLNDTENWEEHRTRKKSIAGDHNSVTVKNLQPATNYEFRLFARNSQGLSDSSEILKVKTDSEPPSGPPLDLIVEPISSTELRIRWKPPRFEDWNGQILGYNIRYRNNREDLGAFNWTRVEKISTDPNLPLTKSIGNLEKYEEYQVTIQAYNEKGPGAYSDPVTALTLEDVPSAPPSTIHCSPLTPHSLQINWQPPPRNSIHGNLQGFRVFVEQLPQQIGGDHPNYSLGEFESKVPSGSLSTIMHNFVPFTNYSIQVAAFTRIGEGAQSKAVFCQTKESVPSEPSAIKAIVSSMESVIVSWLPPKIPNGLVVKFNVYTRISSERREIRTMKRNLPSHVLHYEVADLKRYESYEAWVTAETSAGEGQSTASVPLQGSLTPNIPAAVVSIGSIVVTAWKTNVILQCQHVGTGVTLQWYKRDARLTESSRVKLLTSGSLSIENVERADSGNISCVVKNPHGTDSVTYVVKVQVVPSSPLLHTTAVSNSSVRLQWKQGDNGGTPILGFTLIYKQEGGEWEEINLNRKLSSYELRNLACGTAFEFFLTGFNKIGSSEPSETLYLRTKGSKPILPPVEDFLQSDSTSIRLNFSEWENVSGDCPVTSFTVEYKTEGKNWILVKTEKNFVEISHLSPEMEYKLRVTAYNGAGSSSGEFTVSTSLFKGGLISSNLNPQVPFYLDVYIIVPIVASVASIIIATAGVILCWKKKNFSSSGNLSPKTNLGLADSERDYTVIRAKFIPDCDRYPESADDIYPYATFQLAEPEKTNLAGNIPDTHIYGPRPTSNMDAGLMRGTYRGTLPGHGTAKRRKSRGKTRGEVHKMGESDEYDSIHSDSDGDEPIANSIETIRGNRRYSSRNNCHFPSNDVTMVVTDRDRGRKSLPRRPKVPILNGGEVMIPDFLDETSFIYTRDNHVPTDFVSHYHPGPTELISQLNCDMDLKRVGRRKSDNMFVPMPPNVGGGGIHPDKELKSVHGKKPRDPRDLELYRHQDYTIAV
ncbi:unnamed protein product [Allacma fusca]|uniref:Down syndrome cell adhesion molecule-like protein Dscam2 n=1 Tax=Allacma fusca TaxID=39272 RepID=A0A8J2KSN0_9HEXA|nr:unnamed protein product [Allacma fusca]